MPKELVLFHSRTGNTARLADAIADGARSVRFTEVDVLRLDDLATEPAGAAAGDRESHDGLVQNYRALVDVDDLAGYDALILGSPSCHGTMAAELKLLLDRAAPLGRHGGLADRVGSAFTTVQTPHGGAETTLWSIMTAMASLGMILVPPGYTDAVMYEGGSPYGATAVTGGGSPTDADIAAARHQGARVARVAEWVRHAKGHEAAAAHHHHH